jgi:hypothetical protein
MNENDLRDCFAMFALMGLAGHVIDGNVTPKAIWGLADLMLEARDKEEELGIAAVKTKRQYVRKTYHK